MRLWVILPKISFKLVIFRYTIIYAHQIPKILAGAIIPHYAHQGDAGMDIFSAEENNNQSWRNKNIKTGVKMELPEGFVGLVWDKSGLALKNGLKTMVE